MLDEFSEGDKAKLLSFFDSKNWDDYNTAFCSWLAADSSIVNPSEINDRMRRSLSRFIIDGLEIITGDETQSNEEGAKEGAGITMVIFSKIATSMMMAFLAGYAYRRGGDPCGEFLVEEDAH